MKTIFLVAGIFMTGILHAQWLPFGSGVTNGTVIQFEEHNGQLYACGLFTQIDGVAANGLAVYSNSAWATAGLQANAGIHAVKSLNGNIYVAPYADAVDSNYIYTESNGSWVTVGKGFYLTTASPQNFRFCSLYDLVEHNGSVYVCGEFDRIGNDTIMGIAQWNGGNWISLGAGLSGNIPNTAPQVYPHKMLSTPNGLVVAGNFKFAGDSLVNGVALWDGNNWHPLGEGFNSTVYALAWFQGQLIAGGDFTASGSTQLKRIAKWDGTNWIDMGLELENTLPNGYCFVHTLSTYSDTLFIAGDFNEVTQNSITLPANNIIALTPFGLFNPPDGPQSTVEAITIQHHQLLVGGFFNQLGATAAPSRMASYFLLFDVPEHEQSADAIQIYPNPANDVLWLKDLPVPCCYTIFAMDGSKVSSGVTENAIDIHLLPAGMYTLEVKGNEDQPINLKFIKQ